MIDINDQYNVAEKQRVLLSMMVDFHNFCVKHGIAYTIIGGTLLGAIRDKGFIPWDDDVDILMDRQNFEILLEKSSSLNKYCLRELLWVYKIVDKETDEKIGINEDTPVLDIFIVDRIPSGKKKIKVLGLKVLQGMMKIKTNDKKKYSMVYKIALAITGGLGKLVSTKRKQAMYTSLSVWGNREVDQPLMICNDIFQSLNCEYDSKLMDEYTIINFEGVELMAIKRWDDYLKKQYGDYMTPIRMEH